MAKRYSATLHRRGGILMGVEVPDPIPEAVVRPAEAEGADGAATGRFAERLFRRRSSDDGSLHYLQDPELPEPGQGPTTDAPTRCAKCGRASGTYYVRAMPRNVTLSAGTERLCVECYSQGTEAP